MKKHLLIFLLALILFLNRTSNASASVLYSNTFNNTSLSDWTNEIGNNSVCVTTSGSLTSGDSSHGCIMALNISFNNLKCVSVDANTTDTAFDVFYMQTQNDFNNHAGNWTINYVFDDGSRNIKIFDGVHSISTTALVNTPTGIHNYMFCQNNQTYIGYIDGAEVITYTPSSSLQTLTSLRLGQNLQSTNVNPMNNFVISNILPVTPTPTPTPTPPALINLNVPELKQTSDPWQSQEYDTAHVWSTGATTINNWGCALTSAAMILQYNGITKLPDGTPLDPGTLNTWLKSQGDGYVLSGWVNWQAIARLSLLSKAHGYAPLFIGHALEYKPRKSTDTNILDIDLGQNFPEILEVPGHFVVAKGKTQTSYLINDPYYDLHSLNDYGNNFIRMDEFIPSFTDLSYFLFLSDPSLTVTLTQNGNATGSSYIQQPITNPTNPSQTNGNPVQFTYLTQPTQGNYSLQVSSSTTKDFTLSGFFYDIDGNFQPISLSGSVGNSNPDIFSISFNPNNLSQTNIQKVVTFESVLKDIQEGIDLHQIQPQTGKVLQNFVKDIQSDVIHNRKLVAKLKLKALQSMLGGFHNSLVKDPAYQILKNDVLTLLQSL